MIGKQHRSSLRYRLALVSGSALVAIGAVVLATRVDVHAPLVKAGAATGHAMRRLARSGSGPQRIELPLVSISRIHVAVDLQALASGTKNGHRWSRRGRVRVVLDTGASLPFGTAQAALRFPLGTAPTSRGAEGFAGGQGTLYPLDQGERLTLSLLAPESPRTVLVPVEYLAPTTLHDSDVIAPPEALAPIGGAVVLDFARHVFVVCESIAACRRGHGWRALSRRGCPESSATVPVTARIGGSTGRLRLDTGAASLVFHGFYARSHLATLAQSMQTGSLTGISRTSPRATLLRGDFQLEVGDRPGLMRRIDRLWLVGESGDLGPDACARDGSLGTDALHGCQLLLGERRPHRALLRCVDSAPDGGTRTRQRAP